MIKTIKDLRKVAANTYTGGGLPQHVRDSRSAKEIEQDIRALKKEMKANSIPIKSFMNGGHTSESLRYTTNLFRLKTELERAVKGGQ